MRHRYALAAVAAVVLVALPSAAAGKSKYADVRVVTHTGKTLADVRQYTDDVRFRASEEADCFGETNPSSNRRHRLETPNVLGALLDAADSLRSLRPVLVTDAFFDEFGSFGVCEIGGLEIVGFSFWYNAVNHVGASVGPNAIPVRNGDENLWYLTRGDETSTSELVLRAPARAKAGDPFTVKVTRFGPDGSSEPAAGVAVTGTGTLTSATGRTTVTLERSRKLRAVGGSEDIPSARLRVCVAERLAKCPRKRGKRILGSPGADRIKATRGPDRIDCGRGDDVVLQSDGADRVKRSCERIRRS